MLRQQMRAAGTFRARAAELALGAATCILMAGQAQASDVLVGSAAPTGHAVLSEQMNILAAGNLSQIDVSSSLPGVPVRLVVYRKADRTDEVATECIAPCRLLVPKHAGFTIIADVPSGQHLTSEPVSFVWKQPFWCRGGALCKAMLQPGKLVLQVDADQ